MDISCGLHFAVSSGVPVIRDGAYGSMAWANISQEAASATRQSSCAFLPRRSSFVWVAKYSLILLNAKA